MVKAGEVVGFYDLFQKEYAVCPLGLWYSGPDFLAVGCSQLTGKKMVLHGYGNAIDVYCDPRTARDLFRCTWESRVKAYGGGEPGVARAGFSALVHARFCSNCHGSETDRWSSCRSCGRNILYAPAGICGRGITLRRPASCVREWASALRRTRNGTRCFRLTNIE